MGKRELPLAGLAGLLSIVLGLVGTVCVPIWDFPSTGATDVDVLTFLDRHRGAVQAEVALDAAVAALWLVCGCGVWQRVRNERSMVPGCVLGGFVAMSSLLLTGFTTVAVLLYHLPQNAELVRVLYDLGFGLLAMSGLPTAIALAAFASLAHGTPSVPRLLGRTAAVTAAVHVLLLATLVVPRGMLSLEGPMIAIAPILLFFWIGSASRWLLARYEPPQTLAEPAKSDPPPVAR